MMVSLLHICKPFEVISEYLHVYRRIIANVKYGKNEKKLLYEILQFFQSFCLYFRGVFES